MPPGKSSPPVASESAVNSASGAWEILVDTGGTFTDCVARDPAGNWHRAKVLSTAVGADHIVVTIEVNGATQLLTFDPDTLKPLGRLRLAPKP